MYHIVISYETVLKYYRDVDMNVINCYNIKETNEYIHLVALNTVNLGEPTPELYSLLLLLKFPLTIIPSFTTVHSITWS